MDQSQRANAAQMAARSIKAKPKGRTGRTPLTGPRPGSSGSQFAQPSQNGGGMFGGGIQGSGSFDFAAPGGMTFAAPSFGSNATSSPDVSDNEGRFAGDDRAMKRQFGGPSTMQQVQQPGPFGQSSANPFGTSTAQAGGSTFPFGGSSGTSFSNTNPGNAPASNPFSFGGNSQPVSATPSISFGSGTVESKPVNSPFQFGQQAAVENKPASSPFQFGQQAAQAPSFNSPFNFNSSAPQVQPAPQVPASTPVFSFGSTAPQNVTQTQASKSPFAFGTTTAQEKPAATPFLFGQSPAPPSSSAVSFGSQPATAPSTSNIFGNSTSHPAQTANIFSPATSQPTNNNLFGNLSAPSPSLNNLFGSREQSPAPTNSNLFGGPANTPPTSTEPSPTPNLFGEQKSSSAPTNIFGGPDKPAPTNNMFSSPAKTTAPTNNLFGMTNSELVGTKDLFGTLNKPVDESVKEHKADRGIVESLNGNGSATTAAANPPFTKLAAPTLFGQSSPSNNSNNDETNGPKAQLPSTSTPSSSQQTPKILSPIKASNAPMAANQPPPNGMFPSSHGPDSSSPEPESPIDDREIEAPISADHPALNSGPDPFYITDEHIAKVLPKGIKNDPQASGNWATKYRIDSMNRAMTSLFEDLSPDHNPRLMLLRYMKLRAKLIQDNKAFQEQLKQTNTNNNGLANGARASQLRNVGSAASGETPSKRKLVEDDLQEKENPSKRTKDRSNQGQAPEPKLQFNGFTSSEISKPSTISPFKPASITQNGSSLSSVTPSPTKNKRKAESQITKDTEEPSPLRQIKTPRLNGATVGSNTSNIFKNILDSPSPSKSGSPTKPISPVKKAVPAPEHKDETPKINPFGMLPVPASPAKPSFSPSAPASGAFTPKAPSTSSLFNTKTTPAPSTTFTPKTTSTTAIPFPKAATAPADNSASTTKGGTFKPPVFTSGPVDFLAQFGKKASDDKKDNEEKLLQKAIDADYDSDDDNLEEFKQKYREKRQAELKELENLAKNTRNAFVFKADGGSTGSSTPGPSSKVAPMTEATPKPFFGQSTAQGSGNSVFSSLNVSRTSTPGPFGSSTGSVLDGHAPGKSASLGSNIFAHLSDADSGQGNDADDESAEEDTDGDEENRDPNYQPGNDNASGPGTPASETGDGIASAKKTNFFSNYGTPKTSNLFGGGATSSTPSGGLFGRIGSQAATTEKAQSGSTTPGGLFGRIGQVATPEKEQSGTTTPGGSLFDRITKDSNGNPVRHISTEEKENTQPSTANIFKDVSSPSENPFNKTPGLPLDKTWKPDSPIRFGGADTASSISAPTVSITAPTPTKPAISSNLFGGPTSAPASNLFGIKDPKPASTSAPFSNLFGSSSSAKGPSPASVGFGFGGPSVTSSLFPSAAGSANTSRATSPGATTDADSGVDGDPDAEVHEQINLTAGGPGEEDEEVLHEIRAKARMFSTEADEDGNQWITKGLGPLRVLQHKETKAVRILLRADPLGTIVLNKALLSKVTYVPTAKTVKVLASTDDGKGLETWILQVKTEEAAKELADILEKNKPS